MFKINLFSHIFQLFFQLNRILTNIRVIFILVAIIALYSETNMVKLLLKAEYLADIGFLRPLYVNSNDSSVVGIENDIVDLMLSPEFLQAAHSPQTNQYNGVWSDKMSYEIQHRFEKFFGNGIYREKISYHLQKEIQHRNRHLDTPDIYYLNKEFAYTYMIILANKLCEDHSLGMITDDVPCFNIGNMAKYGNQTSLWTEKRPHNKDKSSRNHQLEQGLLLNFIINGLSISPDATLTDIISFKTHHKDELGRFRTQLAKFTQNLDGDQSIDVMQQEVYDLYNNEFLPAFDEFKAALIDSRIKWFTDTFLKVSCLSVGATSVPMALLGMPTEQALFAGMGISVIASAVSYNIDKKCFLRENPYSYLLSIKRE